MLRKIVLAAAVSLLLMTALEGAVAAQDAGAGGIDRPVTLESVQIVPVTIDVAVPVDGETVTSTVPLSAEVTVRVQLVEDTPAQADAFPDVTLEQGALLLPVLSEMPVGFVQTGEIQPAGSNQEVASHYSDPTAFLRFLNEEVGRQGGAYVTFTNSQYSPFAGGNRYISASVLVMEDAAGADLYLSGAMERELERSDTANVVYRVSAPRLGDNSILFKVDATEDSTQFSEYTLWVRAGNAAITLDARATPNMGNVEQLLEIARTILARGLAQPAQDNPVALARKAQENAGASTQKSEQATPTPEPDQEDAKNTIWDLPRYVGSAPETMDIGGFQVRVDGVGLLDFAEVKALDSGNESIYQRSVFDGAKVFGMLSMTLINGADEDLSLPSSDAVLVVGTEQVQMSDFQFVGDNPFGQALLPGVERQVNFVFVLTDTDFADLGDSVDVRLQMRGPITEDYKQVVEGAKYRAALTMTPAP